MKNLQQAADDVGTIAEAVKALGTLLDKFHADHGEEIYSRLEKAWPDAASICGPAAKPLYELERQLTPPDEL